MTAYWRRFLDALLGPLCTCGARVFPKDERAHRYDHTETSEPA